MPRAAGPDRAAPAEPLYFLVAAALPLMGLHFSFDLCSLGACVVLLWRWVQVLCSFKHRAIRHAHLNTGLFVTSLLSCKTYLDIVGLGSYQIRDLQAFFTFCVLAFHFLDAVTGRRKDFYSDEGQFFHFSFYHLSLRIYYPTQSQEDSACVFFLEWHRFLSRSEACPLL